MGGDTRTGSIPVTSIKKVMRGMAFCFGKNLLYYSLHSYFFMVFYFCRRRIRLFLKGYIKIIIHFVIHKNLIIDKNKLYSILNIGSDWLGKRNVAINNYLSDKERFADLFNVKVFSGKQIVMPEDLTDMDTKALRIYHNAEESIHEEFIRDQLKQWKYGARLLILGLEPESSVHYALPVKIMKYESIQYEKNYKQIQKKHRKDRDLSQDEYISGFGKRDFLNPVITIALYHGKEEWDAPITLFDLIVTLSNSEDIMVKKEECCSEGGYDMCRALQEWLEEERAAGRQKGLREGRQEGRQEGELLCLIGLTMKKKEKGMSTKEIAELLEEDEKFIQKIVHAMNLAHSGVPEEVFMYM